MQDKIHFAGRRFAKNRLVQLATTDEAKLFVEKYKQWAKEEGKGWCEYCKEIPLDIFMYTPGRVYVLAPEERDLRQMIDEVAQMFVVDGVGAEEALKRSGHPLFKFVDHVYGNGFRRQSAPSTST